MEAAHRVPDAPLELGARHAHERHLGLAVAPQSDLLVLLGRPGHHLQGVIPRRLPYQSVPLP
eukprot:5262538-Pyramimonas_sp.AAC.1